MQHHVSALMAAAFASQFAMYVAILTLGQMAVDR